MSSSSAIAAQISGVIPYEFSFSNYPIHVRASGQQKRDKVCPTNRLMERREIGVYISHIGIGMPREKGLNNGG